jgi:hypothetical protein
MAEQMVAYTTKENFTISLDPSKIVTMPISIFPLTTGNIPAGTSLAQSSLTLGGATVNIKRPAASGETRTGILMTDIAQDTTVTYVQADLKGAVEAVVGVFKTANITDEGTKGTLQSETIANTRLIFK